MAGKRAFAQDTPSLPKRVQDHVSTLLADAERFVLAAHSQYRVNSDIPFAWVILTSDRLLVCSTHRRGIHHILPFEEINSVDSQASQVLRVLPEDPAEDPLPFPSLSTDEFNTFTQTFQSFLLNSSTRR